MKSVRENVLHSSTAQDVERTNKCSKVKCFSFYEGKTYKGATLYLLDLNFNVQQKKAYVYNQVFQKSVIQFTNVLFYYMVLTNIRSLMTFFNLFHRFKYGFTGTVLVTTPGFDPTTTLQNTCDSSSLKQVAVR